MARRIDNFEAQYRAAVAREAQDRKAGLRARSATYDSASGRVMLELTNGYIFGFDPRKFSRLRRATVDELASVELSPSGGGLHWEALHEDLSVPNLLYEAIGRGLAAREFGRRGGRVSSETKAASSRANGAKGGRPRKNAKRRK